MIVLNFGHPLTGPQVEQLRQVLGADLDTRELPVHFNHEAPFVEQVVQLVDRVGLDARAWQTEPLIVVPPTLHVIATVLMAEMHGRIGNYPAILRLRPVSGAVPVRYEVAEVIDLNAVRDAARSRRSPGE